MTKLHLRPYQTEAIDAVFAAWADGMKRPAVVLPTGAGKTVVFAHMIKRFRDWTELPPRPGFSAPGERVMVLVHRDELADQAIDKIRSIAPDLNVGKVKAEDDDIRADVMVCSVQTLASMKRRDRIAGLQGWDGVGYVGLIITDECHHGVAESYRKVYDAFPDALNLGVTATLQRGDGVGLGGVWDDVVYSRSVLWMISKGFLTDLRGKSVDLKGIDFGGVKRTGGDFQAGDLGRALEESDLAERLPSAYLEHAGDRPGIVFTPTVATAEQVADSFNGAGIRTAVISGETPRDERQKIFADYRSGKVQVLANCMVLTEGFDAPWASCAVIARPTQSAPLYTQMVGRVLRTWPGKTDALVLNVAGPGQKLCSLIDLEPGAIGAMGEGELLSEAAERENAEAEQRGEKATLTGLSFKDVDMFAASAAAWLRTPAGVLFIGCGDTSVFLWPTPDAGGVINVSGALQWDVGYVTKGQKPVRTSYVGLDIGSAMAWGEAVADDHRSFSVQRSARWRKGPRSEAQERVAGGLGIDYREMTKGQLSDAISVVMAGRQFDHWVKA